MKFDVVLTPYTRIGFTVSKYPSLKLPTSGMIPLIFSIDIPYYNIVYFCWMTESIDIMYFKYWSSKVQFKSSWTVPLYTHHICIYLLLSSHGTLSNIFFLNVIEFLSCIKCQYAPWKARSVIEPNSWFCLLKLAVMGSHRLSRPSSFPYIIVQIPAMHPHSSSS